MNSAKRGNGREKPPEAWFKNKPSLTVPVKEGSSPLTTNFNNLNKLPLLDVFRKILNAIVVSLFLHTQ